MINNAFLGLISSEEKVLSYLPEVACTAVVQWATHFLSQKYPIIGIPRRQHHVQRPQEAAVLVGNGCRTCRHSYAALEGEVVAESPGVIDRGGFFSTQIHYWRVVIDWKDGHQDRAYPRCRVLTHSHDCDDPLPRGGFICRVLVGQSLKHSLERIIHYIQAFAPFSMIGVCAR